MMNIQSQSVLIFNVRQWRESLVNGGSASPLSSAGLSALSLVDINQRCILPKIDRQKAFWFDLLYSYVNTIGAAKKTSNDVVANLS